MDPTTPKPRLLDRFAAVTRGWLAPCCAVCGVERGDPVCAGCSIDFFAAGGRRCERCALRVPAAADGPATCARCLRDPPRFDATLALADYTPPLDGLITALKFGHRLELARVLGRLLAMQFAALARIEPGTLLLAVPLAFERKAERGFNQAHEIARVMARELRLELGADLLLRVRHATPQESLGLDARRRNVRGAFAVTGNVRGRAVVVVDDVMTSGATLDEVAGALKAAGARSVTNAVVARTP
ncbi:MAG TPA: ComF family protein [Burkholderiaceae bacterium]|nr:ComF family protein [Burkholderiaceae bacterium]